MPLQVGFGAVEAYNLRIFVAEFCISHTVASIYQANKWILGFNLRHILWRRDNCTYLGAYLCS